ncbi:hypothetical protein [Natranaerobius trueperi]
MKNRITSLDEWIMRRIQMYLWRFKS